MWSIRRCAMCWLALELPCKRALKARASDENFGDEADSGGLERASKVRTKEGIFGHVLSALGRTWAMAVSEAFVANISCSESGKIRPILGHFRLIPGLCPSLTDA